MTHAHYTYPHASIILSLNRLCCMPASCSTVHSFVWCCLLLIAGVEESTATHSRSHRATVHIFASANLLFALTPEPTNQPLHNNYVIIVYKVTRYNNNINGGAWNHLYVLRIPGRTSCDVPPTKWQCSCGQDLLTLSEYHINKHLTGLCG